MLEAYIGAVSNPAGVEFFKPLSVSEDWVEHRIEEGVKTIRLSYSTCLKVRGEVLCQGNRQNGMADSGMVTLTA